MTIVYARCDLVERRELWGQLITGTNSEVPCLLGGDFNIVRTATKGWG